MSANKARQALPSTYSRPAMDETLDRLTDPGASGTSGNGGTRDTSGSPGTRGNRGDSETFGTTGKQGVTSGTSGNTASQRQHVKLAEPLAAELRDAVWFLSEYGRPRVKLGEVLDEAVAAWLAQTKAEHNGGEDFPHRGSLR